jgi:phosphoribosylanthranilate isomerase
VERVRVKVCGLTSVEDAAAAVAAGADALGFVLWPGSPRAVDLERARSIARSLPPFVSRVGVFVDASREELEQAAAFVGLDVLQLHGEEPPELAAALSRRTLKAIRVGPGFEPQQALRYVGAASGLLLDTRADGAPGGSGQRFDWSLACAVRASAPFLVLAGGLDAGNVAEAIAAVGPDAVDVSSGVEAALGRKDADKLRAFVAAVEGAGR